MLKSVTLSVLGASMLAIPGAAVAQRTQEKPKSRASAEGKPAKQEPQGEAKKAKDDEPKAAAGEGQEGGGGGGPRGGRRRPGGGPPGEGGSDKTIYDFGLPSEQGTNIPLSDYKNKVLLIVNIARKSNYADQLQALNKLNENMKDKGLVVIGVPSNEFGDAEPGTDAEVAKAYQDAKLNFLITARSPLLGIHQLPLYDFLTKEKSIPDNGVHWNYTKYIVDRKGKVLMRFGSDVAPDSLEMQVALQEVLAGTWKPKKERPGGGGRRGGGGDGGGDDAPPAM